MKYDSKRIVGERLRAASIVSVVTGVTFLSGPGDVQAKDELIDTGSSGTFSNKLPSAPVMNNDGEVAYRKNFGTVIIGGATRTIRRSTPNGVPVSAKSIVGNNQDAPQGIGKFSTFNDDGQQSIGLRINDIGQGGNPGTVMFHSTLSGLGVNSSNNQGIYTVVESTTGTLFLGEVARKGDSYNDAGDKYVIFQAMGIDRIGEPAYLGTVDRDAFGVGIESVIFRKQNEVLEVVDTGDGAPSSAGEFLGLGLTDGRYQIVTNNKTSQLNSEKIAFYATLTDIIPVADFGVYRGSQQSQVVRIAQGGQFRFGGTISALGHPDINNEGWTAYKANIFVSPEEGSFGGIFVGDDSETGIATLGLALEGDDIPGGGFVYTGFGNDPDVNNQRFTAYHAGFNGPDHRDNGLYRGTTGGLIVKVAEEGDFPDIPGVNNRALVGSLGRNFTLNDANQIAFVANIQDGSGGSVEGIYVGQSANHAPYEVARVGRVIDGKTVEDLEVNLGVDVGGSTGFNNEGQVAYLARFTDGSQRIYRHTPTLKISVINSDTLTALWETASNWNLGIVPDGDASNYDVVVGDGAIRTLGGTVFGPTSEVMIGSLTVGYPTIPDQPNPTVNLLIDDSHGANLTQGQAAAAADHRDAPILDIGSDVDILETGRMIINGNSLPPALLLPAVQAAREVRNNGVVELMNGGTIMSQKVINNGLITGDGDFCAQLINQRLGRVHVGKGDLLAITATHEANTNDGQITVDETGELRFSGDLINNANGRVMIAHQAQLAVGNLVNNGEFIGVGELRIRGALAGRGVFGDGSVSVAGLLMPANGQIGSMSFGGDLSLGPDGGMEISYGGPDAITAASTMLDESLVIYDTVEVGGVATLNGALQLEVPDDVAAQLDYGDEFKIMTYDSHDGTFDTVKGAILTPNLALGQEYTDTALVLVVTAPGDANLDLKVDAADLNKLAVNWRKKGKTWQEADFTGDGQVGPADLNLLAINWQFGVDLPSLVSFDQAWAAALAAAIPEPSSAILLTLTIPMAALRRRR